MAIHEMFIYLCVQNATEALDFYAGAFGAREKFRLVEKGGRIGHAEMDFDGATLMLSDEFPEYGIKAPPTIGGSPVTIHLHVDHADALVERAAKAGASIEMAPTDQFYGERSARSCVTPSAIAGTSVTASKPSLRKRCNSATTK